MVFELIFFRAINVFCIYGAIAAIIVFALGGVIQLNDFNVSVIFAIVFSVGFIRLFLLPIKL